MPDSQVRLALAEDHIKTLEDRVNDLERLNEEKKNWFLHQMWGLLKLVLGVTALTFLTEMAKGGCRTCRAIIGYFTGGGS